MRTETKKSIYRPVAIAPGETLLEILGNLNMSQKEAAERMGRPLKLINEIVKGKASITPETAIQLERAVGKEAQFWVNLEADYQAALARIESEKNLVDEVKKAKAYPYDDMVQNGWIPDTDNTTDRTRNLLEYFGVNSLDNVIETRLLEPVFYRVSNKKKVDTFAASAWLRKGVLDSQEIETKTFDEDKLKEKISLIRQLTDKKPEIFLEEIKNYLAEVGVAFVITKSLTNVPINGVSRWLGSDKALIQLSIYGKYRDKFWFSLFHEIGHILFHGKRTFNIDISNGTGSDVREAQADEYARNTLIPHKEYIEFLEQEDFSPGSINRFANKLGIHPCIVVGRLQFENRIGYNQLNHLRGQYVWAA